MKTKSQLLQHGAIRDKTGNVREFYYKINVTEQPPEIEPEEVKGDPDGF